MPGGNERLARILEGAGYIVASTTNDGVAIDMAGASGYDALLIDGGGGGGGPAVCGDGGPQSARGDSGVDGE